MKMILKSICLITVFFPCTLLLAQDTIHHVSFEPGKTAGIIIMKDNKYSATAYNQNGLEIFNRTLHLEDSICKIEFMHYESGAVKQILILNTDRPGTYTEEEIRFDKTGLKKNAEVKRHFDRNIEIRSEPQEFKKEGIILTPKKK